MELSARWPIKSLCRAMSISRSGFYKWKARLSNPSDRLRKRMADVALFQEYHAKYPSHGYCTSQQKVDSKRMTSFIVVVHSFLSSASFSAFGVSALFRALPGNFSRNCFGVR